MTLWFGRVARAASAAGIILGVTACAQFEVIAPNPQHGTDPERAGHFASTVFSGDSGVIRAADHCQSQAFSHVRMNMGAADGVGNILTLGTALPYSAEFRCSKFPVAQGGGLGVEVAPTSLPEQDTSVQYAGETSLGWGAESGFIETDACAASDAISEARLQPRPVIDALVQLITLGAVRTNSVRFRCHDFSAGQ